MIIYWLASDSVGEHNNWGCGRNIKGVRIELCVNTASHLICYKLADLVWSPCLPIAKAKRSDLACLILLA